MRHPVLFIGLFFTLLACGKQEKQANIDPGDITQCTTEPSDSQALQASLEHPTGLNNYFDVFLENELTVKVESIGTSAIPKSKSLPAEYLALLAEVLPEARVKSARFKPISKVVLGEHHQFLLVFHQGDYGDQYFGLLFNTMSNCVEKAEKVAEYWGDAGDSENTSSIILFKNQQVFIEKHIETCHAEVDPEAEVPTAKNVDCQSTTASVVLGMN